MWHNVERAYIITYLTDKSKHYLLLEHLVKNTMKYIESEWLMFDSKWAVIKFATGRWFSPVSSINKTDHHDITEILLKVSLNTITLTQVSHLWAISLLVQTTLQWDDDICFVLQSMDRHVTPLWYIILIPSQSVLLFLLNDACLVEKQQRPIL